ncbi:MAG: STAS domain-containing protein [Pyrinomonadaceae bacterium]
MSNLNITQRRSDSVVILDLQGKIKLGEDNLALHQTLRRLVEEGEKKILLNLAGVSNIDSSGLGELIAGYATLQKNGGDLKLLNLTERVSEIMMITKLLTVFDAFDDEAQAIGSFKSETEMSEASA